MSNLFGERDKEFFMILPENIFCICLVNLCGSIPALGIGKGQANFSKLAQPTFLPRFLAVKMVGALAEP